MEMLFKALVSRLEGAILREWLAPNWILLVVSTHPDLLRATPVLERTYAILERVKKAGALENFFCIYEIFPEDPHIDFGLKMKEPIPSELISEILSQEQTRGEPQLEGDEVLKALHRIALSELASELQDLEDKELLHSETEALLRLRPPDKELVEEMKALATTAAFMYRRQQSDILKLAYFLHMYSNISSLLLPWPTWMSREVERLGRWDVDRLKKDTLPYLTDELHKLPDRICAVKSAIAQRDQAA